MWIEDFVTLAPPGAGKKRKSRKNESRRGMGGKKQAGMPRLEQGRREKAGKVSPGGAWKRKTGLDAPLGAEKKRKSGKSKAERGMREKKGLECPAGSRKEEKKREK